MKRLLAAAEVKHAKTPSGKVKRAELRGLTVDRATVVYDDGRVRRVILSSVYLDEPAPGTAAWAIEQAVAGYAVQRKLSGSIYKRMIIDVNRLVIQWFNDGHGEPDTLELDDRASRDLETAHRRLLNTHLEKELKSIRVMNELRRVAQQ